MNAVGIDVSKGKSMVSIMRPFGEIVSGPFEVKHTSSEIKALIALISSVDGETRIVMEHTGRYYEVLAHQLVEANLFVSTVNAKLIKDFDNDSLRKVKSDKADSLKNIQKSPCISRAHVIYCMSRSLRQRFFCKEIRIAVVTCYRERN